MTSDDTHSETGSDKSERRRESGADTDSDGETQHCEHGSVAVSETNNVVQSVIGALSDAVSREEIQQTVCDRLVESSDYELAWIGERHGGDDRLVPRTSAGTATDYLEGIEIRTDDQETGRGPGGRAYRTGTVQVVNDVRTDPSFAPWCTEASEHGLGSLVAVPLRHGTVTHGILAVYASETDAFSDPIVEGFTVLGKTIGLALTAVQNKHLVQRQDAMTLEFVSKRSTSRLSRLADRCGCRLETAGTVGAPEQEAQYVRVDGADPEAVVDTVEQAEWEITAAAVESDAESVITLTGTTALPVELAEIGARLVEQVCKPGEVRIVVTAPTDADVRAIQDVVGRAHPDAELVSKTECKRPFSTPEIGRPVTESLTERQREVLQKAYRAGYYDWPRETTAEELAATLDIASPTLHQHLRRAERNLLQHLLE